MNDSRIVMNFAEDLNELNDALEISEYYRSQSYIIKQDIYNKIVILLTMCINKELKIILDKDNETSVEEYPYKINKIISGIIKKYKTINLEIVSNLNISENQQKDFLKYLDHMVGCLLSGVKYIEKKEGTPWNISDEQNEWNTRFRREERIRDRMKQLISEGSRFTKFTIKNRIEIPYMYVLAWDLPKLVRDFHKNYDSNSIDNMSYIANLRKNTSIELNFISDNLLYILLHDIQVDNEKFELSNSHIKIYKHVSYKDLLPTIAVVEKVDYNHDLNETGDRLKAQTNHVLPPIKKEVLRKIPLLPMEIEKSNYTAIQTIDMMVALMQEENKTKEYLKSDILYLKDCIIKICQMALDWIWDKNIDCMRLEESKVEDYLVKIINGAKNLPRTNSNDDRDDHIEKICRILAAPWDTIPCIDVKDEISETYIEYAYFSVLKFSRNWISHELIKKPSISFVVFLFIISLRFIFDLKKIDIELQRKYMAEEIKLFKFFEDERIEYKEFKIEEIDSEYMLLYHNVKDKAFSNNVKSVTKILKCADKDKDPHHLLKLAGGKNSLIKNQISENEIFLSFWLSLHFGKSENKTQKLDYIDDPNLILLLERTFICQQRSFLLNGVD